MYLIVLEPFDGSSWISLTDFAMPFMVQTLREYHNKMNLVFAKFDTVEQKAVEKEVEETKRAEELAAAASFQQPLAIGAPPGMVGYDNAGKFKGLVDSVWLALICCQPPVIPVLVKSFDIYASWNVHGSL